MRYTVVWTHSARAELAELWLKSSQRKSVSFAADAIDERLAEDASAKGTEISEGLRAILAPPIRVLFAVSEQDLVVEVLCVQEV